MSQLLLLHIDLEAPDLAVVTLKKKCIINQTSKHVQTGLFRRHLNYQSSTFMCCVLVGGVSDVQDYMNEPFIFPNNIRPVQE